MPTTQFANIVNSLNQIYINNAAKTTWIVQKVPKNHSNYSIWDY